MASQSDHMAAGTVGAERRAGGARAVSTADRSHRRSANGHGRGRRAGLVLGAAALAATAAWTHARARRAEQEAPPIGRFVAVDGVRLHYVDRGQGRPVVLLHGNGTMIQDFSTSGLLDMVAERHRVIAFDRPGYGYSERPRDRVWTPDAQAWLLGEALRRLEVERPVVVGHSWGTLVAVAMALRYPRDVAALALLSGYYYPSVRGDVLLLSPPAIPVVGDVMRYTVSPLLARLMWGPMLRRLFAPAPVSPGLAALEELAVRPGQLRASAAESALMIPAAAAFQHRYRELEMPVVIAAGADDRHVETREQSERLHHELEGSDFHSMAGVGHMLHHTRPEGALAAIERAVRRADEPEDEPQRLAR